MDYLIKFESDTTCILVKIDDEIIAVSETNSQGGSCDCCSGVLGRGRGGEAVVLKVVDMVTMGVLYRATS